MKAGAELYDHCVLGKLPTSPGSTARTYGSEYGKTVIGENCILCPGVVLYTGTTIGHNTLLGDNCSIREKCEVGDYCIISRNVSVNYETTIGNHTKIMDNSHITGNMRIGNHVFISVLVASTNDNSMGREKRCGGSSLWPGSGRLCYDRGRGKPLAGSSSRGKRRSWRQRTGHEKRSCR